MDKVYVLTIHDVTDGTVLVDFIEAYKDFEKASIRFEQEVKEYLQNNDFTDYIINRTNTMFQVYKNGDYYFEHVEINIKELNIIL